MILRPYIQCESPYFHGLSYGISTLYTSTTRMFRSCHSVLVYKVKTPKTNTYRKTNTMYQMHTLGASKCMLVVHSVGFFWGGEGGGFTL